MADLLQRRHWLCLTLVVVALHTLALLTFGATFWVDSAIYASLGDCLFSPEKMRAFYDATGRLMYSHISPGEPALWAFARLFPVNAQWPVLALTQHALAAAATIFAFGNLQRLLPGIWNLACAALLSIFPLYQSLHNALLTESASSSLLLVGLTVIIRVAHNRKPSGRDWLILLTTIFIGTLFRGYLGALLAGAASVVLLWRTDLKRWPAWLALLSVSGAAIAFYPVYRWAFTGQLFSPGLGTNRLVLAAWANPQPSPALLEKIAAMGWPGDPAAIFTKGFNYEKARNAGITWQKEGVSFEEIVRRISLMSSAVMTDRPGAILIQARCALAASGMISLAYAGTSVEPVYQHFTLAEERRHQRWFYSWLSWLEQTSYRESGKQFFINQTTLVTGAARTQRDLWAALEPHLSETGTALRDPIQIGRLPLDFWALLGWLAIALCCWRRPLLGLVLAAPIAGNFLVMGATPLGSARYCYPILPLYFVACSVSCALMLGRANFTPKDPDWLRRLRCRRAKKVVVGAGNTTFHGWFETDRETLDLLKREDFLRYWKPSTRHAFLAEHVWEHLSAEDAAIAVRNVFEFLRPGGRLRIAVPDGHNPDPQYHEHVRPGGSGPGADDHKMLWTLESLSALLSTAGFRVVQLEYWDANGKFHANEWSSADGHILRSKKYDPRNQDGRLQYTSLIVDGIKPA